MHGLLGVGGGGRLKLKVTLPSIPHLGPENRFETHMASGKDSSLVARPGRSSQMKGPHGFKRLFRGRRLRLWEPQSCKGCRPPEGHVDEALHACFINRESGSCCTVLHSSP